MTSPFLIQSNISHRQSGMAGGMVMSRETCEEVGEVDEWVFEGVSE